MNGQMNERATLVVLVLAIFVVLSTLYFWSDGEPKATDVQLKLLRDTRSLIAKHPNVAWEESSSWEEIHQQRLNEPTTERANTDAYRQSPSTEEAMKAITLAELSKQSNDGNVEHLFICGRATNIDQLGHEQLSNQYHAKCKHRVEGGPILILEGNRAFGRTGNHVIDLLHAIQYARDHSIPLGIMDHPNSWAMNLLQDTLGAFQGDAGLAKLDQDLCIKVFEATDDMEGWMPIHSDLSFTRKLFYYFGTSSFQDYIDTSKYVLQSIYNNINTPHCQGINAAFGVESGHEQQYTAIHMRQLENHGYTMLEHIAEHSGCDPKAAIDLEPEYIKAILEPLGMLVHPIVVITDHESDEKLARLLDDEVLGPLLRTVPPEDSSVSSDMTLATMATVFIGNPASTFSAFIGKSRMALGLGNNHFFRAKDEDGEWKDSCTDEERCIFSAVPYWTPYFDRIKQRLE